MCALLREGLKTVNMWFVGDSGTRVGSLLHVGYQGTLFHFEKPEKLVLGRARMFKKLSLFELGCLGGPPQAPCTPSALDAYKPLRKMYSARKSMENMQSMKQHEPARQFGSPIRICSPTWMSRPLLCRGRSLTDGMVSMVALPHQNILAVYLLFLARMTRHHPVTGTICHFDHVDYLEKAC